MKNFTLRGSRWCRGRESIHPATVRALYRRGGVRLWVPITPDTGSPNGYDRAWSRIVWNHLHWSPPPDCPLRIFEDDYIMPFYLHVPARHPDDHGVDSWCSYRVYPRIRGKWRVVGATQRGRVWCWEVAPC